MDLSYVILAFFIGVITLDLLPHLLNVNSLFVLFIATIIGIILIWLANEINSNCSKFIKFFSQKHIKIITTTTTFFLCGFIWANFYSNRLLSWELPPGLENKNIVIEGYIASLPKTDFKHTSFIFEVIPQTLSNNHQVNNSNNITNINFYKIPKNKFLLNWYTDYPQYPLLKVGDYWHLHVKLKRPHSTYNPGEFDYEAYLLQNQIRVTGYVVSKNDNKCIKSLWYHHPIDRARQKLAEKIRTSLANRPYTDFIIALLVGDQNNIEVSKWQVLRRTGTIHFLIIAGLHIGFIASFMFFVGKFLWKLIPSLCLTIPAQKFGAILALLSSVIYSTLAGFSIPTQRALIMVSMFMSGILLNRNINGYTALLIALFCVLLFNPLAPFTSGFWLSFAAVFFIIYALQGRLKAKNKLYRYCKLQWALTIGLAPLTLALFQQTPIVSFLGNSVAVPWIGFIVIPLVFLGGCTILFWEKLGQLILIFACKAISIIWIWLEWLASLPIASFEHAINNFWILAASLIGILLILAPRGWPNRCLGCMCLAPLFFYTPPNPNYGEAWFTLLDVGQGLASVIRTQNHTLIYDTGPKFFDNSDTGDRIILPFLHHLSINKVDMLVVSHGDEDHSGGAKTILNNIPVTQFITSVPEFFAPYPATHCYAEQNWQWDGVNFIVLHPQKKDNEFSGNNASCVLRVSTGSKSVLLTGDIEKSAEFEIVKNFGSMLQSSILVAPHHGSDTSSSLEFINAVQPEYVLFATGYLNRFHFPSTFTVTNYLQNHVKTVNSAYTGAITFKFNEKSTQLNPKSYRETNKHFWQ